MKNLFKKIVSIGLAATMALGMAVTSFAEGEPAGEESAAVAEVWVNGKDVKEKIKDEVVVVEADLNKTYVKALADLVVADAGEAVAEEGEEAGEESAAEPQVGLNAELGKGNKYVVAVSDKADTEITTVEQAIVKGKAAKSDLAKASYKKANEKKGIEANITVTAGKKAGTAVIWVAEINKAKEIVAYASFEVAVKEAPKKFSVAATIGEDKAEKKATVNVGTNVALAVVLPEEVTASDDTTYTWTVKGPKGVTEDAYTLTGNDAAATFTAKAMTTAAKSDKYTITCLNDQSQKKATFTVTVVNDLTDVKLGDIKLDNADEAKVVKELVCNADYTVEAAYAPAAVEGVVPFATTDKVKLYVAEIPEGEDKAYEIDETGKTPKFKFTGTKAKALTAKIAKDGKITLTAKKGTVGGTQVQLIWVSTHADKTIDVYTTIVTIGEVVEEEAPAEDSEATE